MSFTNDLQLLIEKASSGGYVVRRFNGMSAGDAVFASHDLSAVLRFIAEAMGGPGSHLIEGR